MPIVFEQAVRVSGYRGLFQIAVMGLPFLVVAFGAGYFYSGKAKAPSAANNVSEAPIRKVQTDSPAPTARSDSPASGVTAAPASETTLTGVTHTRRAEGPVATVAAVATPAREDVKSAKKAPAAPTPAAPAPAQRPVPVVLEAASTRFVTHTKAPRSAAPRATVEAVSAVVIAAPAVAPASACAEAVAALGLCKADSKGEGK